MIIIYIVYENAALLGRKKVKINKLIIRLTSLATIVCWNELIHFSRCFYNKNGYCLLNRNNRDEVLNCIPQKEGKKR